MDPSYWLDLFDFIHQHLNSHTESHYFDNPPCTRRSFKFCTSLFEATFKCITFECIKHFKSNLFLIWLMTLCEQKKQFVDPWRP